MPLGDSCAGLPRTPTSFTPAVARTRQQLAIRMRCHSFWDQERFTDIRVSGRDIPSDGKKSARSITQWRGRDALLYLCRPAAARRWRPLPAFPETSLIPFVRDHIGGDPVH